MKSIVKTVRDLIGQAVDVDVIDDYTEELYIAYCGPYKLYPEAEERFKLALDLPVLWHYGRPGATDEWVEVLIDGQPDEDKALANAIELFEALAGYCSEQDFDRWFEYDDDYDKWEAMAAEERSYFSDFTPEECAGWSQQDVIDSYRRER